jgi:hypothetical protein
MNGKERVNAAMRHQETDRTPVFCQLSLGHYLLHTDISPEDLWLNPEAFGGALVTLAERYNFDGILVNLHGRQPDREKYIRQITRGKNEVRIDWTDGSYTLCPYNDNPHHFRAVHGAASGTGAPGAAGGASEGAGGAAGKASGGALTDTGEPLTLDDVDPEKLYYIEPHDISGISYPYEFGFGEGPRDPADSFFPGYFMDTVKWAAEHAGDRFHISGEVFSPFTQLMELFGYTDTLISLVDSPEKVEQVLGALAKGTARLAELEAEAGADAVLVSSAFAGGGFISREHYKRFIVPFDGQVTREFHRKFPDVPIYVHTCGAIGDRIDLILEAGYDGVDTLDPPPLGNTDIVEVKERYGDRLFLKGNIDPVNLLLNGTPREVYEQASYLVREVGSRGGYILSSACSVSPAVTEENIMQLDRASRSS